MYAVSDDYKSAVYAPSRAIKGRVTFDISDTTIETDTITVAVTSEIPILSDKSKLTDKVRSANYNFATFEDFRFKLDGSFSFADDQFFMPVKYKQLWISNVLCDFQGVFTTQQVLTFTFGTTHTSGGITVSFDQKNNEYAIDYDIKAYNTSGTLILSKSVTGNTEAMAAIFSDFVNYKKIEVIIKKWSKPFRRARVAEVDFGIIKVYEDDKLINFSIIEEMDITTATVPIPEFKFTVDNSDRLFNILNPIGFYKYLKDRQKVSAELGLELADGSMEYVPLCTHLLREWTSDEGAMTATFAARSNIDLLNTEEYENLTPKASYSLLNLAQDIFAKCGIKNYIIDSKLNFIYSNALVQKASCLNVLQMIAIAGCANIFVTRKNWITIKVSPTTMPVRVDLVDLDNAYEEPQINLDSQVKYVDVSYFPNLDTSNVKRATNTGVADGDLLKLENNTLINTAVQATDVGNWLLRQKSNRAIHVVNWRANPAHELGDVLGIENSYGQANAFITKNTINYEGYLTAQTEARGVVS